MKILLLSPYDAVSHRLWRRELGNYLKAMLPGLSLTEVVLPARYFSWRFRGNSLSLSRREALLADYDLVIATSMTDLAALRGLNHKMASLPVIVYFHENQFAYPDAHSLGQMERQITSLYTALSADWIFFNSNYNRRTFLAGAETLLRKMPDEVPAGIVAAIEEKSEVVPVAIAPADKFHPQVSDELTIVWNHRWEVDKGPELLLDIVTGLLQRRRPFKLSLLGQQFRKRPPALDACMVKLKAAGNLLHCGFIADRGEYLNMLSEHRVVLSTANQEFQGLAVQEAMIRGCLPVVPDALSYPEYVPACYRYDSAAEAIERLLEIAAGHDLERPDLTAFSWEKVGPVWLDRIQALAAR